MNQIVSTGAAGPSLGLLSTYPPTKCGLATFTRSLRDAVVAGLGGSGPVGVVSVANGGRPPPEVTGEVVAAMDPSQPASVARAAECLGEFDVAVVQHEFGIFGPDDGVAVLGLLDRLPVPAIVTLHTVPSTPSVRQREILEGIAERADGVVVMSFAARNLLARRYRIDAHKVHVVPHGAHGYPELERSAGAPPTVLTWGLVGPGKGIEWGIRAIALLRDLDPRPRYRIWGQTHPNVLRAQGERYRHRLLALADELGVRDMVELESAYLTNDALAHLVGTCDVVLLPYDSREQATSGVLIEAIGAGKPVVATAFPHASELLATGAGRVVPHEHPGAIAAALEELLTDPVAIARAREHARRLSGSMRWPRVAERYLEIATLASRTVTAEVA